MGVSQADPHRRIHCLRPLTDVSEPERSHSRTSEITEAVVGLLRVETGRGPTMATTAISNDLVVVTLADCLTKAEKTLAEHGGRDDVMRVRAAHHQGIRVEAIAVVEAITGRKVAAYLAAQELDPDVAVLAFYFGR